MIIRDEAPDDAGAIAALTTRAFATAAHSSGTEALIVQALRDADALTLSLVAERAGSIAGHAAFSPIEINHARSEWFGLGPISVDPERQKVGIGSALIEAGIARLRDRGAGGCVVLGDPAFYGRFGFACAPALTLAGVPPEYFQVLAFAPAPPAGVVDYHPAFAATS